MISQRVEMGQEWAWMSFALGHSLLVFPSGPKAQHWRGSLAGLSNLLLSQVLQINGRPDDPPAGEPLDSPASIP